jgi:hypothetical protein
LVAAGETDELAQGRLGDMHIRDAERWRLRAATYRAIGASSLSEETRRSCQAMAEECDRVAQQATTPPPRQLSAKDCLGYAEQCDALARRTIAKPIREHFFDIAEQWRKLARWGDQHSEQVSDAAWPKVGEQLRRSS